MHTYIVLHSESAEKILQVNWHKNSKEEEGDKREPTEKGKQRKRDTDGASLEFFPVSVC